jgi:hypothetical protein
LWQIDQRIQLPKYVPLQVSHLLPPFLFLPLPYFFYFIYLFYLFILFIFKGNAAIFAGNGKPGYIEGNGTNASFNQPTGLAIDQKTGNLFVSDYYNHVIRKISPQGREKGEKRDERARETRGEKGRCIVGIDSIPK